MGSFADWERAKLTPPYRRPVREVVNDVGSVENELPTPQPFSNGPFTFTVDPSHEELLEALKTGGWLEVEVFGDFQVDSLPESGPRDFRFSVTRETRVITVQSARVVRGSRKNQLAHHFEVLHHYDGWAPHRGFDEYKEITHPYVIVLDSGRPATMAPSRRSE